MSKPTQYGCKKCGAVIAAEVRKSSDRVEVRVKDAQVQERAGQLQICCKKCRSAVAEVSVNAV